jgi:L-fuconolactonase
VNIVDAHQHFWDPSRSQYPWMSADHAAIRRRFGPEDLLPLLRERGVQRTLLVQTRSSLEESREFLALAAHTEFIAGVVAWVDLTRPDVAAVLADLAASPGGDRLVGIRHQVQDEEDPRWLLREDVQRGLGEVGRAGLAFDFLVGPAEPPAASATARLQPETRFVVDHCGNPPIRRRGDEQWDREMSSIATLPNVYCKLSGLVTEADWQRWTPADLRPYVARVLEWFGSERLMFGSDWPVCLLAGSYAEVFDAYVATLDGLSDEALQRVLGQNAIDVYRLDAGLAPSATQACSIGSDGGRQR